jgi:hypothetical protein
VRCEVAAHGNDACSLRTQHLIKTEYAEISISV